MFWCSGWRLLSGFCLVFLVLCLGSLLFFRSLDPTREHVLTIFLSKQRGLSYWATENL